MSRQFRLSAVLRARQAQEDIARGEVLRARAAAAEAAGVARRRELALRDGELPDGPARAVVAALVARQSLAAGLAAAHQAVEEAEEATSERMAELAEAAKRRRVVERLAERHDAARRAQDAAAEQRVLDEVAGAAREGVEP